LIGLLVAGCGESTEQEQGSVADGITVDTLVFADTIGVFIGDSGYEFGALHAVLPVPEGFTVLDGIYCRISMFDQDGFFIKSQGRQGSGPGEYSTPRTMCRLNKGEYFIFDYGARRMTLLDESMNFISDAGTQMTFPLRIAPGTDSIVVIKEIVVEFTDDQLVGGYRIYAFNAYTGEEGIVYREKQLAMGADMVDLKPYFSLFTTDIQGNVYLSNYDSDEFAIEVVSPDGEVLRTITIDSESRGEFDPEIHTLIHLPITMPLTTEAGTSVLKISYPDYQPYISDLAIDAENHIWVRREGLADCEAWDVVSQEGDLLRQVILYADTTGTGSYPRLLVSEFGMAARFLNEEEIERFFTLEQPN
jgi:hypothetical protein